MVFNKCDAKIKKEENMKMNISIMTLEDIHSVIPMYISFYNTQEGGCWTEETVNRRITQVITMNNAYSLIMRDDENTVIGFAMGYFKQYDDIVGYTLEEIVIAYEHQRKGLGTLLLKELENRVREKGASCVELQAVKDDLHEQYYGKAGYRDASNFVLKVKWFE